MSFGLINVVAKDGSGVPLEDMDQAVLDMKPGEAGMQEGKEWLALVRYLQQFPPPEKGGLPVIPERYDVPDRSMVPVSSNK
jgi:hypothetical protein